MLNWLTRYAFVSAELELAPDGTLRESVLDVGCGPHGLSTAAPEAKFAGVDVTFPTEVAPGMFAFRNEPGPLPFADGAFDTVVCLDVLEHVPPTERAGFVHELARVAASRVLLACPSDAGGWIDDLLRDAYAARGIPDPGWLNEHDEHGLPTAEQIAEFCAAPAGFEARELTMTNGHLAMLTVLGDMLPELAERAAVEWRDQREEWLEVFKSARFGACYRKGYAIDRLAPRDAIVDPSKFDTTVWDALRCPACAEDGFELRIGAPFCESCGHELALDPSGSWDLTAPALGQAPPPAPVVQSLPSPAPAAAQSNGHAPRSNGSRPTVEMILAPDSWARPLEWLPTLSTYMLVPLGYDAKLYLDGRSPDVAPMTLRRIIERACGYLAEDSDFCPIELLEGTVDGPEHAHAVAHPSEIGELLGLDLGPGEADAGEIADQARWVKALLDHIQADIDRATFQETPPVELGGVPLVTVRIPTYGATELLVERAIASTLAGPYPNVEVLVCSDGPQPHARAAVEAVADSRVRYLELEERPEYASFPESFWRTAGVMAVNRLLDEARGAVIAPLDHDDAFTHDHIPVLLQTLRQSGGDFVYGQAMTEYPLGDWRLHGSAPLAYGELIHASVMYSARLAHMRYDPHCWLIDEPADWNMWRRIRDVGAGITHLPHPVAVHFKERSSIDRREEDRNPSDEAAAGDVLGTPAREFLAVRRRTRARIAG